MEVNCVTNHLPIMQVIKSILRKDAATKLVGLPIVEVSGHTEPAVTCKNSHLKFEDFLSLSIGVDAGCSKPALRVKYIDSCDANTDCANNADPNPLNNIFAYDSTAKTYALVLNKSL